MYICMCEWLSGWVYALRDRLIAGLYYATVLTPGTVVYIILYYMYVYMCVLYV